jgi:release factor glutamine methyltransferase
MNVAGPIRLDQALRSAAQTLRAVCENPNLDAQILLASVMQRDRSWLLAHPEAQLEANEYGQFIKYVERVKSGEALPYVIGERWFFGRLFSVEPSVLIPRPETEILIEAALEFLERNPLKRHAVDVGCGSGCIAVTLCAEIDNLEMLAVDRYVQAVKVTRRNAQFHQVESRIKLVAGDLLGCVVGEFDLICANLPYVPSERLVSLEVADREPLSALDGGKDGLEIISRLLSDVKRCLSAGGRMILEIDETQTNHLIANVQRKYPGWEVAVRKDLAGLDRALVIDRKS